MLFTILASLSKREKIPVLPSFFIESISISTSNLDFMPDEKRNPGFDQIRLFSEFVVYYIKMPAGQESPEWGFISAYFHPAQCRLGCTAAPSAYAGKAARAVVPPEKPAEL
jgi:hypothetical protein